MLVHVLVLVLETLSVKTRRRGSSSEWLAGRFVTPFCDLRGRALLRKTHVYKEPYAVRYSRGPYAWDAALQERMHFKNTVLDLNLASEVMH